jgi:Na+/melibiose symporter-like transporter
LLYGLIDRLGFRARAEGAFLGWWSLATKLNLALAAGTALPLLGLWGYVPGGQAPAALQALTWAYVVLPCVLKLCAAVALYVFFVRPRSPS